MPARCEHVKANGRRCGANARRGSRWCFFHDQAATSQRREAQRRGGRERAKKAATLPPDTPDVALASVGDVAGLLGTTINQVRRGELDSKAANAVGYLSSVLLKALQDTDLARQLDELRRDVEEMKRRGDGDIYTRTGAAAANGPGPDGPDHRGALPA